MKHTIYILFSEKYSNHHIGYTINLEQQLSHHNETGNDWTKNYRPWEVIYTKEFENKKDALKYEKWLKSGVGKKFIKTIKH